MTAAFITGTSRGLGKAIAELLLENDNTKVFGISRNQSINHPNYQHIFLDFSNTEIVDGFTFPEEEFDKYILINNAGTIDPIAHIGHRFSKDIIANYNINLVSPSILINKFMLQFSESEKPVHIINISSGAGKYPIDGWSTYSASKAGLDMFSLALNEEFKIDVKNNFNIHSIAPGIVDTKMQSIIRESNTENFSNVEKFKDYFESNKLSSPEDVAIKIKKVIDNPSEFPDVIIDVRNF